MKMASFTAAILTMSLSLATAALAAQDSLGDPLPEGAIQRLGTSRMRYSSAMIADLGYLPDGRGVVAEANRGEVWDLAGGKLQVRQQVCDANITSMVVRGDGKALLIADAAGNVHEWDLSARRVRRSWPTGQAKLIRATYSPDLKRVLTTGSTPPTLKEWDIATGKELISITGKMESFAEGIYGPGGNSAIANGSFIFGTVLVRYDLSDGKIMNEWLKDYYTYRRALALSEDDQRLLAGSRTRATEWRLDAYKLLKTFTGHSGHAVSAVAYCREPDQVLTGSRDGSIRRWNRLKGKVLLRWSPHNKLVSHMAVSPDGKWVFSCGRNVVAESSMATGRLRVSWDRHSRAVTAAAVLPDGNVAVSGSADGTLRRWDLASGKCLGTVEGATLGAYAVAVSPDGRRVAAGCKDGVVREFSLPEGALVHELKGHFGYVRSVTYTRDGQRLLSSADDGSVCVWKAGQVTPSVVLQGHRGGVLSVALSPDGNLVLTGGRDGTVRLWDLNKGALLRTGEGHRGWVEAVTFAGDNRHGLSSGRDGRILKWDLRTGKILSEMVHGSSVRALACTPDGKVAFAGGKDTTITCWNLTEAKRTATFTGHAGPVLSLVVTPDGKRLVSSSEDLTLLVWKIPNR
ncbi:MAG: hypothetical protein K8R91_06045 [Phycisphaerae bacterium]|nr:hypothetical protein [Phycisphaerae bacterium]